MALLPFLAVGGLLASSKKVRKEIKRFGKRVKKQLKRTVKSKAFKIIAAAALIITGAHFVAGMLQAAGAGGTAAVASTTAANTAATVATNTAATAATANAGIVAKTATAIANGARTAYTTVTNVARTAGGSTTAFLTEGFNKVTGDVTGEAVKDTALNVDATQFNTPADAMVDFKASELAKTQPKPPFKAIAKSEPTLVEKMSQVQERGMPTYESITTAPASVAKTGKTVGKTSLLAKEFGEEFKKQTEKPDTTAPTPASFDSYTEAFEGSTLFTPQQIADLRINLPLIDPRTFASGAIDANAFFRTKQQLA